MFNSNQLIGLLLSVVVLMESKLFCSNSFYFGKFIQNKLNRLKLIHQTLVKWEQKTGHKISFLICWGDFEAVRNEDDLDCMSVPPKYRKHKDFKNYYFKQVFPVLTIFVGGNHEAMNYLQELYGGGWVAENIYFMGYSGVINVNGLRIAGVSGIHNKYNSRKGHFETFPFAGGQIKSAFHTRQFEIMKLSLLKDPIDIFVSHDWPNLIGDYSDIRLLTKIKPFFSDDLRNHNLGSPNLSTLLTILRPRYWFSAHLHIHWEVWIPHVDRYGDLLSTTQFLSLDKPIVNRGFMDILGISTAEKAK